MIIEFVFIYNLVHQEAIPIFSFQYWHRRKYFFKIIKNIKIKIIIIIYFYLYQNLYFKDTFIKDLCRLLCIYYILICQKEKKIFHPLFQRDIRHSNLHFKFIFIIIIGEHFSGREMGEDLIYFIYFDFGHHGTKKFEKRC